MRGMPWYAGETDGIRGHTVSASAAIAGGGDRVFGSADLLGSFARNSANGNVREWEMGIGGEAVEGGSILKKDQRTAAGCKGGGGEIGGRELRGSTPRRREFAWIFCGEMLPRSLRCEPANCTGSPVGMTKTRREGARSAAELREGVAEGGVGNLNETGVGGIQFEDEKDSGGDGESGNE